MESVAVKAEGVAVKAETVTVETVVSKLSSLLTCSIERVMCRTNSDWTVL